MKFAAHCPFISSNRWTPSAPDSAGSFAAYAGPQAGGCARAPTRAWLVALTGVHRGEDFRLCAGPNLIGSSYIADIAITGMGVSGSHATITCHPEMAELRDLASREGTLVNGERASSTELQDGDEIQIGDSRLMFRLSQAFAPGYRPTLRPRPVVKDPPSALTRRYVAGWLVRASDPPKVPTQAASDYRLLGGKNTVGSSERNALILRDQGVGPEHAVLVCANNQCTITATSRAHVVLVNGVVATGPTLLRDSDKLHLGSVELYLKWF